MASETNENPRNGFRKSEGVKETEMPPAKRSKILHEQDGRVCSKWNRQANGDVLLNLVSVDLNVVCDYVDAADKVQKLEVEILHKNDVAFESGENTITESSTLSLLKAVEDGALAGDKMQLVNVESSLDKSRWVSDDVSSISNSSGHIEHIFSKVSSADKHSIPVGQRSESWSDDDNIENDSSIVTEEDWHDSMRAVASLSIPMNGTIWNSCRSVFDYEKLNKINEGTYGVVYRARDKKTGEIVALKKLKMEGSTNRFPATALREINFLMSLDHPSLVRGKEVVMGDLDSVFVVMEYLEHDLNGVLEEMEYPFSISEVKCLMIQLLQGVKFLHDNWIMHRDLKSSNILFNNKGELKICDFGLARTYEYPLEPYTAEVVTLWYRAPEILFKATKDSEYVYYAEPIDMWSVGCIMGELLSNETLFPGNTEIDQINKIIKLLGNPNDDIWPGFSDMPNAGKLMYVYQPNNLLRKKFPDTSFTGSPALSDAGFDLLNQMLTYDPVKRITVDDALNHRWFQEVPLAKDKEFMPTYPAQNETDRTCE